MANVHACKGTHTRLKDKVLSGVDIFAPRVWEELRITGEESNVQGRVPRIILLVTLKKRFNFCGPWSPHLETQPVGRSDPYALLHACLPFTETCHHTNLIPRKGDMGEGKEAGRES